MPHPSESLPTCQSLSPSHLIWRYVFKEPNNHWINNTWSSPVCLCVLVLSTDEHFFHFHLTTNDLTLILVEFLWPFILFVIKFRSWMYLCYFFFKNNLIFSCLFRFARLQVVQIMAEMWRYCAPDLHSYNIWTTSYSQLQKK